MVLGLPGLTPVSSKIRTKRVYEIGAVQSRRTEVYTLDDVAAWSEDGIRALIYTGSIDEAERQTLLGNPPVGFFVDGAAEKPLHQLQRSAEVLFGTLDARPMMTLLKRTAESMWTGNVTWRWKILYARNPLVVRRAVNSGGPVLLGISEKIILVPTGADERFVAWDNILYMDGGTRDGDNLRSRGTFTRKTGLIKKIANSVNRKGQATGYRVVARNSFQTAEARGFPTRKRNSRSYRVPPRNTKHPVAFYQGVWFFAIQRRIGLNPGSRSIIRLTGRDR